VAENAKAVLQEAANRTVSSHPEKLKRIAVAKQAAKDAKKATAEKLKLVKKEERAKKERAKNKKKEKKENDKKNKKKKKKKKKGKSADKSAEDSADGSVVEVVEVEPKVQGSFGEEVDGSIDGKYDDDSEGVDLKGRNKRKAVGGGRGAEVENEQKKGQQHEYVLDEDLDWDKHAAATLGAAYATAHAAREGKFRITRVPTRAEHSRAKVWLLAWFMKERPEELERAIHKKRHVMAGDPVNHPTFVDIVGDQLVTKVADVLTELHVLAGEFHNHEMDRNAALVCKRGNRVLKLVKSLDNARRAAHANLQPPSAAGVLPEPAIVEGFSNVWTAEANATLDAWEGDQVYRQRLRDATARLHRASSSLNAFYAGVAVLLLHNKVAPNENRPAVEPGMEHHDYMSMPNDATLPRMVVLLAAGLAGALRLAWNKVHAKVVNSPALKENGAVAKLQTEGTVRAKTAQEQCRALRVEIHKACRRPGSGCVHTGGVARHAADGTASMDRGRYREHPFQRVLSATAPLSFFVAHLEPAGVYGRNTLDRDRSSLDAKSSIYQSMLAVLEPYYGDTASRIPSMLPVPSTVVHATSSHQLAKLEKRVRVYVDRIIQFAQAHDAPLPQAIRDAVAHTAHAVEHVLQRSAPWPGSPGVGEVEHVATMAVWLGFFMPTYDAVLEAEREVDEATSLL
jgi:hypothetical protein